MEELIKSNIEKFKNLNDYQIINIAGVENECIYKEIKSVKDKIKSCERKNQKTLTLTVNRMLTGTTVEEWDTMMYLKDTSSPQEYDQAIFRLQNQYVTTYKDENGDVIRYNMKPQTLLVDFAPARMFYMQEQKSQIYNANVEKNGNDNLEERIRRELEVSPIIMLNHNKINQVTPIDILSEISEYSNQRSVADEANVIPVDFSLLDDGDIRAEIERQAEINSREGLRTKAIQGEGDDIDTPDQTPANGDAPDETPATPEPSKAEKGEADSIRKKFATYYSRILFFAFLTQTSVKNLNNIVIAIDADSDNKRIAENIGLNKKILVLFRQKMNPFILSKLDYKIQNLNRLANDTSLEPLDRAANALRKFGRLSDSEVVTPAKVADEMVALLPKEGVTDQTKILDIAAKQGEFAIALYKRFGEKVRPNIYSAVTSSVAYEFTHKVYEMLGMPIENIFSNFTSYNIIGANNEAIIKQLDDMKFNVVVGNPPYQEDDGGAGASAKPIYHCFVDVAKQFKPNYISMIMPSRWYAGGKGLDEFRDSMLNDISIKEFHDCLHPEEVFPNTNNRGGVCFFLMDRNYNNVTSNTKVVTHEGNGKISTLNRPFKTKGLDIFIRYGKALSILEKIASDGENNSLSPYVSAAKAFGFRTFFIKDERFKSTKKGHINPVVCFGRGGAIGYVDESEIISHKEWINVWKVYVPESNNIGTELNDDNQNSFLGKPNTICTETFLVVGADLSLNETSCNNLSMYLRTKFVRFLHSLAKISQHGTNKTYRFVPLQDFSKSWTDAELYAKYGLTEDEIAFVESMIKPME